MWALFPKYQTGTKNRKKKLTAPLFGSSNKLVASSGGSNQLVATLGGKSQLVADQDVMCLQCL